MVVPLKNRIINEHRWDPVLIEVTTQDVIDGRLPFILHVQLQGTGQHSQWIQLPLAADRKEARNWQTPIEQAARRGA